jgi:hypothetical protein
MIILNNYSITADGKWLTVDVIANPVLEGVYIDSLRISCTGNFGPSDSSATTFDRLISEAINEYTGEPVDFEEDCPTEIRIKLDVDTLKKPFYLLVVAADPEESAKSCAYKSTLTAVTFNKYPMYQTIACAAKEVIGYDCKPPLHFIDYLMRLKALESSIAVGDAEAINYYFDWLVLHGSTGHECNKPSVQPLKSGCGCH